MPCKQYPKCEIVEENVTLRESCCERLSPNNSGAVGSILNYEESYRELNTKRRPSYIRTMLVNNLPFCC